MIGICAVPTVAAWSFWSQPAVLVAGTYLDAVTRAGGQPVVLPPSPDAQVTRLVEMLDALVLAGGTDIEPELYGQPAAARTEETHCGRDLFELELATAAMQRDVPTLGICRGLQILNVATGGTLHQHLLDAGFAEHRPAPARLDEVTNHAVDVEPDSLLGECGLAGLRAVNSHHHQGVATIGAGGRVIARSRPDGSIEAVEWPDRSFVLGVQWHPEDPPMDDLFRGLVDASRARHLGTPLTTSRRPA